jgi:hypothetical protein
MCTSSARPPLIARDSGLLIAGWPLWPHGWASENEPLRVKTTLEIPEDLLARAREAVRREGTTMRALIEEGLQAALARRSQTAPYRWPDLSVDGEGLAPGIEEGSWEPLRERIYKVLKP